MTISYVHGSTGPDPSQDSAHQHGKTAIREAIEEFLSATSSAVPRDRVCPRCGRTMQRVNATFSLYGSDKQWNVPIPACRCAMGSTRSEDKNCGDVSENVSAFGSRKYPS